MQATTAKQSRSGEPRSRSSESAWDHSRQHLWHGDTKSKPLSGFTRTAPPVTTAVRAASPGCNGFSEKYASNTSLDAEPLSINRLNVPPDILERSSSGSCVRPKEESTDASGAKFTVLLWKRNHTGRCHGRVGTISSATSPKKVMHSSRSTTSPLQRTLNSSSEMTRPGPQAAIPFNMFTAGASATSNIPRCVRSSKPPAAITATVNQRIWYVVIGKVNPPKSASLG
jgi:hypothetical protein